jgi:anti-sigma B factor antagonist
MVTQTNTRQVDPDITVYEITGRLNLGNTLQSVESSIRELISGGSRKLAVDLTGLRHIDSAGMGTLLACNGEMSKAGGQFRLAGACGQVAHSFALVHLDVIIKLDPDLPASLGHLAASRAPDA